mgnify:CR=1 FL=1
MNTSQMSTINTNTRAAIIEKNQPLTLSVAKTLVGKMIAVCWKDKTGEFADVVDRVFIKQVSKVKGEKRFVILDGQMQWSYHCINGKFFTLPDFQAGKESTVYFIEL